MRKPPSHVDNSALPEQPAHQPRAHPFVRPEKFYRAVYEPLQRLQELDVLLVSGPQKLPLLGCRFMELDRFVAVCGSGQGAHMRYRGRGTSLKLLHTCRDSGALDCLPVLGMLGSLPGSSHQKCPIMYTRKNSFKARNSKSRD